MTSPDALGSFLYQVFGAPLTYAAGFVAALFLILMLLQMFVDLFDQ